MKRAPPYRPRDDVRCPRTLRAPDERAGGGARVVRCQRGAHATGACSACVRVGRWTHILRWGVEPWVRP